jgi:DNA-binding LytR/AlgR family response regulator
MSADRLTILAVDDEQTQVEDLARLLRGSPLVEEVECAYDGHDALGKVSRQRYDAIFLDVRMPDLDGLELARVLRQFAVPPQLVFVSAYDNAAVEAFELRAVDYLRKPVSRRRVEEALERVAFAADTVLPPTPVAVARGPAPQASNGTPENETIAVANLRGGATRLIRRGDILFVQSHGDFVKIITDDGRYLLRSTLGEIENRWARFGFVRVHRQYIANLLKAVELRPHLGGTADLPFADGQTVPIARRHVSELGRRLGV